VESFLVSISNINVTLIWIVYTPELPDLPGQCGNPLTCIEDLDCDDQSYCLYTTSSYSGTCVAFEQLGGPCGEFLGLHFQHQCHPDLDCIYNPDLPDLPGQCGILLTCIEDVDCDDTSYCLYTTDGPSDSGTCVVWEELGGPCGESLGLHFQHQCHPDLDCIYNPDLPDLPGQCGNPLICIEDEDCDDKSYCLYTTGGYSGTCVAFEQLGGPCGESILGLHFQHKCHPDLDCLHILGLPDLPGQCVNTPY
jgi:hypothetical protein